MVIPQNAQKEAPVGIATPHDGQQNVSVIPFPSMVIHGAFRAHKSQGSEFEIVILLMTMHHYPMLERNLLYTANTRAKKMIVFLASWAAVKRAVEQCHVNCRNTFLVQRIRKEVKAVELPAAA